MVLPFFFGTEGNPGRIGKQIRRHGAPYKEKYNRGLRGPWCQAFRTKEIAPNRQPNHADQNQQREYVGERGIVLGESCITEEMKSGDKRPRKVIHRIDGKHEESPDNQEMQRSRDGLAQYATLQGHVQYHVGDI